MWDLIDQFLIIAYLFTFKMLQLFNHLILLLLHMLLAVNSLHYF